MGSEIIGDVREVRKEGMGSGILKVAGSKRNREKLQCYVIFFN